MIIAIDTNKLPPRGVDLIKKSLERIARIESATILGDLKDYSEGPVKEQMQNWEKAWSDLSHQLSLVK